MYVQYINICIYTYVGNIFIVRAWNACVPTTFSQENSSTNCPYLRAVFLKSSTSHLHENYLGDYLEIPKP
jgi:hypothetical protein